MLARSILYKQWKHSSPSTCVFLSDDTHRHANTHAHIVAHWAGGVERRASFLIQRSVTVAVSAWGYVEGPFKKRFCSRAASFGFCSHGCDAELADCVWGFEVMCGGGPCVRWSVIGKVRLGRVPGSCCRLCLKGGCCCLYW